MRFCPYIYARTLQGPRIWDDRKQYLKTKTWDLGRRTQNQRLGTPGAQNPQFWEPRSRTLGSGTSRPMNQILEPRAQNHRVQDPGLSVYKIFKTFNFTFSFFFKLLDDKKISSHVAYGMYSVIQFCYFWETCTFVELYNKTLKSKKTLGSNAKVII